MVRGRLFTVVMATLAVTLVLLGVGAIVNRGSAATSVTTSRYVLYVGHGVGVVATLNLATDCSSVYLTRDFVHWRNITPPLKGSSDALKGTCLYAWSDAFFTSSNDGWLLARNTGSTQTILRHTINGGTTWSAQPGGDTGSNAGSETISFVNSSLGWRQQFGVGSNGAYALERTLNGGTTWSMRSTDPRGSCPFSNDVF
jgi:hypothetical protein